MDLMSEVNEIRERSSISSFDGQMVRCRRSPCWGSVRGNEPVIKLAKR